MEMKQKEQEINKRKKRLLWKEKRMKETVLNAMNPVEREIFEKELQKVHLKKSTALNDIGKTVWDTEKDPGTPGSGRRTGRNQEIL